MKKLVRKYIWGVFLIYLCSCVPEIETKVNAVRFGNIGFSQVEFVADIAVHYRYIAPLEITRIEYMLYVNDYFVGQGQHNQRISLPKRADTVLTLPCSVEYKDLSLPIIDILAKGKFNYKIIADISIQILDWKKDLKVIEEGKVY